jgi:hypothetical protein
MTRKLGEAATGSEARSQLEEVEQLMAMAQMFPNADVWGQKLETLSQFSYPHSGSPLVLL